MAEKETKIVKVKEPKAPKGDTSVDVFIKQAIGANVPVETMEKLFALREKVKAEQAKEAFVRALAQFQSDCPVIEKTKKVLNKNSTTVRYMFAPIDSIVKQIQKPLGKAGLSYTWTVENGKESVKATCKVTHLLGHSEESSFDIPIDAEGYMTAPQKVASALTFAKRYSLCNALGISTGDEDTDATDVNPEKDAKSVKSKIMFLLKALKEPITSKLEVETAILKLTGIKASDENFEEILGRLQVIKEEQDDANKEV